MVVRGGREGWSWKASSTSDDVDERDDDMLDKLLSPPPSRLRLLRFSFVSSPSRRKGEALALLPLLLLLAGARLAAPERRGWRG